MSFSSQRREGYQEVIPFPTNSELGQVPWVVDPQTAFPKAGYATSDTKGGQNLQVIRGKALWKVTDNFEVTIAGDYTLPEPVVVPDDGARRDDAGGRRAANGVQRVAAGSVRLHGRAVQLLHQHAGGVAQ